MKRPTLVFLAVLWIGSLVTAYFVGSNLQQSSTTSESASTKVSSLNEQFLKSQDLRANQTPDSAGFNDSDQLIVTERLSLDDISNMSPTQLGDLLTTAFAMPVSEPKRAEAIEDLLKLLAVAHPMEALEMANSIESLRDRDRAMVAVLEVWGKADPLAALEWAMENTVNATKRTQAQQLQAVLRGYAENNPTEAFALAYGLPSDTPTDERLRSRVLSEVIETQIRNGGIEEARATIQALEDGQTKSRLMGELVDEWASYDPASAAAFVTELGDEASNQMKSALVSEWAESDPVAAAAWLDTLDPEDPIFGRSTAEIIQQWAQYDLTASAEWLNTLPASPELDWAVANYTFRAAQEDPASAMSWAESVTNERMQERLVERVASSWKNQDPEGFESYLDAGDFSDEQKEALRNAKSRGFGGGGFGPPGGGGGGGGGGRRGR